MAAGIGGALMLALGIGSIFLTLFANTLEETTAAPPPPVEEILPELSEETETLAEDLEHLHEGIQFDWEGAGTYEGAPVDLNPGVRPEAAPGVLLIETTMLSAIGAGTGVVLTPDGVAVTNYHVVAQSATVDVTVADTGEIYTATVLGRDRDKDVAVLKLHEAEDLDVVSISRTLPPVGAPTASVGNGAGQGYLTAVPGEVLGHNAMVIATEDTELGEEGEGTRMSGMLQVSQDVISGYSGGPTIDENGQTVAITTAASVGDTADDVTGFAVPIDEVLSIVGVVLSGEESGSITIGNHGALGIIVGTANNQAVVLEVSSGSAAEEIGLQPDDVITAVNGEPVTNSSQATQMISSFKAGDTVNITWVTPDGVEHTETATLQEAVTN